MKSSKFFKYFAFSYVIFQLNDVVFLLILYVLMLFPQVLNPRKWRRYCFYFGKGIVKGKLFNVV